MFLYHYVFPRPSNLSQNDAKILEKQQQEIQQQLLAQLEKAVKLYRAERAAQKARREAEVKAKEAERQRIMEKEERKKRTMEYFQWL